MLPTVSSVRNILSASLFKKKNEVLMREQSHLKCPGLSSSANGYQPVGDILLVFRPQSHPLKDQILGFSKQELFLTGRCKREEDVPMYWFTPPNIDRAQAG